MRRPTPTTTSGIRIWTPDRNASSERRRARRRILGRADGRRPGGGAETKPEAKATDFRKSVTRVAAAREKEMVH